MCIHTYPGGGHGNLLQYYILENPRGQRSLADSSPWGSGRVRPTKPSNAYGYVCSVIRTVMIDPSEDANFLFFLHIYAVSVLTLVVIVWEPLVAYTTEPSALNIKISTDILLFFFLLVVSCHNALGIFIKYVSLGEPCLTLIIRASFLISLECDMINTRNSSLDLPELCIFMFRHKPAGKSSRFYCQLSTFSHHGAAVTVDENPQEFQGDAAIVLSGLLGQM